MSILCLIYVPNSQASLAFSLKNLSSQFKSNEGYLNVAMRVLASQGFIEFNVDNQSNEVTYSINSKSKIASDLFPLYKDVVELSKFAGNFHNLVVCNSFELSLLLPVH